MQIFNAAQKYQLISLKTECIEFLDKELNPKNALTILEHCLCYNETDLTNRCLKMIEQYTKKCLPHRNLSQYQLKRYHIF